MRQIFIFCTILFLFFMSTILSSCQKTKRNDNALADSVKIEFLHAWQGYQKYAWGFDSLKPLSKKGSNRYETSFVLTPVDAYDTMILMGLKKEAKQAQALILNRLSFDQNITVNVFEFNSHLLGGLLSAYQLSNDPRFLALARDLARRLLPAFASPTGMPYRYVNLKTGKSTGNISNPAEVGSYLIEFGVLSRLTGDSTFYKVAKKASQALYDRRSSIGLVGSTIDVETGRWIDKTSHIGAMVNSYYEYLLKGFIFFHDPDLGHFWRQSVNAVNSYLADEYHDNLWYGRVDMESGKLLKPWFGASDAAFPAILSLDGQSDRAFSLLNSCFQMWQMEGIEPELLNYRTMRILSPKYPLSPEIFESTFYLHYFTGNQKYRQMGRIYFEALKHYCRTEAGYCGLKSVVSKEKEDIMPSSFLGETMKYLYLLFADNEKINLSKTVFNTKGHPMFVHSFGQE